MCFPLSLLTIPSFSPLTHEREAPFAYPGPVQTPIHPIQGVGCMIMLFALRECRCWCFYRFVFYASLTPLVLTPTHTTRATPEPRWISNLGIVSHKTKPYYGNRIRFSSPNIVFLSRHYAWKVPKSSLKSAPCSSSLLVLVYTQPSAMTCLMAQTHSTTPID